MLQMRIEEGRPRVQSAGRPVRIHSYPGWRLLLPGKQMQIKERLRILSFCPGNFCRSRSALKRDVMAAYSAGIETG